ncbi:Ig-like domain-containing protein, partial [Escherichia coli]
AKGKTTTLTVTVEPENATDKTFRAISGNGQFAAVAEITVNNVPGG